jgi:hypothetical protein
MPVAHCGPNEVCEEANDVEHVELGAGVGAADDHPRVPAGDAPTFTHSYPTRRGLPR